jgi:sigma-B regulation protein RsbU (phosphoserine phosphatase)
MQPAILGQVRASLLDKRAALSQWLSRTPAPSRAIRLGPAGETAVTEHLDRLDEFIAQADAGQLGLCTVCHDFVDSKRLVADYTAQVCLDHLSPEAAFRLEQELELAQVVQRSLLPAHAPDLPGIQLAAFTRPAHIIGGDYFDFVGYQAGDVGWVVGDVAGHGVAASLHMAGLQALCRAIIPSSAGPAAAAEQIQRQFVHNSRYTTFVSLFLAVFDPSSRTLTYANAGHNPPLLLSADGHSEVSLRWLHPTGAAIGLIEEGTYTEERVVLRQGDLVVMYTDGVVEATDPEGRPFEAARLADVVGGVRQAPAGDVVRAITQALEDHLAGADPADDITLVVARVI